MRVDDGRYKAFLQEAAAVVPQPRIFTGDWASAVHSLKSNPGPLVQQGNAAAGNFAVCAAVVAQVQAANRLLQMIEAQGCQKSNTLCDCICVTALIVHKQAADRHDS
jgi:hypothetical protein